MLTETSLAQSLRAIGNGKRIRGGLSSHEYEQLNGNNSVSPNRPNFSESRGLYKGIGWGVTNSKLINLPSLNNKLKQNFEKRASMEREVCSSLDFSSLSPVKRDNPELNPSSFQAYNDSRKSS